MFPQRIKQQTSASNNNLGRVSMLLLRRLTMSAGVALMLASAAYAQTGTITVTGTNPEAVSMTDTTGAVLSSTIALGTLTPTNTNTFTTGSGSAVVRLRSNKAYTITAQSSVLNVTGIGSADGGDTITLSDIGFGITGMTLTGGNVANSGSRTDSIVSGFDVSGGWPTATNGLTPSFGKTLASISSSTQLLSGTRISKKGNLSTSDNFISVTIGVATLPQFFTPNTGFSSVITLTIAAF
jgi:hypothetical protein